MIIEQNGEGSCHLVERGKVLVNELGGGGLILFVNKWFAFPQCFVSGSVFSGLLDPDRYSDTSIRLYPCLF